jgi:hypothetical protein
MAVVYLLRKPLGRLRPGDWIVLTGDGPRGVIEIDLTAASLDEMAEDGAAEAVTPDPSVVYLPRYRAERPRRPHPARHLP